MMDLLVDGLNYNKSWGVPYDFDDSVVVKSVVPHWDLIEHIDYLLHMPLFSKLSDAEIASIKQSFLVLDYTWESVAIEHLYYSIHLECEKYSIPEDRVILVTGNLDREKETYNRWFSQSGFKRRIGTFSAAVFVEINSLFFDKIPKDPPVLKPSFITFSRNPRPHRTALNYLIATNDINADFSQSSLSASQLKSSLSKFGIECKNSKLFSKPRSIDRDDFNTTRPVEWTEDICVNAIDYSYILVQETILEDIGFYITEKTFKYFLFNRPILIWGQPGVNHYLKDLGYSLYNNYFDLSFDTIKNDADRLCALFEEIKRVDTVLKGLTNTYDWVYKDRDTIEHNKRISIDGTVNKQFVNDIKSYMESVK